MLMRIETILNKWPFLITNIVKTTLLTSNNKLINILKSKSVCNVINGK